jgi:uncharacterized phage protein (TIGR01671 family)
MNREIKFRTWMSFDVEDKGNYGNYKMCYNFAFYEYAPINYLLSNHKFPIMQYTGLKDKNGEEIYEGDIVSATYSKHKEKDLTLIQKVCFDIKSSCYSLEPLIPQEEIVFETTCNYCPLCWAAKIKIIGNIYENPELLK